MARPCRRSRQAGLKEGVLVTWAILGDGSKALIHTKPGQVTSRFGGAYPSAMRSFNEDLEASLAHLTLPALHRRHIRTTNLVERSFEEERRRVPGRDASRMT